MVLPSDQGFKLLGNILQGPESYRLLTSGLHLHQELENLNKWGLNIFCVSDYAGGRSLTCIMYMIFQVMGTAGSGPG